MFLLRLFGANFTWQKYSNEFEYPFKLFYNSHKDKEIHQTVSIRLIWL
jgi:hypothetical protein